MNIKKSLHHANAHLRYWAYCRKAGYPFAFRFAVAQWFRRIAYELSRPECR
jgi:hypothetical protein